MVSQPKLDYQILLYQHLQVLEMKTLVVSLALHLAHMLQNLVRCQGQITSFTTKRPRVDRDLMDILNRMNKSTTTIEKIRIEVVLLMHRDNLLDLQEN